MGGQRDYRLGLERPLFRSFLPFDQGPLSVRGGQGRPLTVRLVWRKRATSLNGDHGEGFRMPFGVRKPPKHEPAGLRQGSMGISAFYRAR